MWVSFNNWIIPKNSITLSNTGIKIKYFSRINGSWALKHNVYICTDTYVLYYLMPRLYRTNCMFKSQTDFLLIWFGSGLGPCSGQSGLNYWTSFDPVFKCCFSCWVLICFHLSLYPDLYSYRFLSSHWQNNLYAYEPY